MSDPNEGLAAVLAGERTVKHGSMGGAGMTTELYRMYRLAILGDFDPDMYGMNTAYTIAFLVMTVMINIIMMNVLISLVSEGFGETNKRKQQESRITRALKIVELEATYTAGYMVHWQSGPKFHVTRFPSILLGDGVMQRRPGKGKGAPKQQGDGADNAEMGVWEGEKGSSALPASTLQRRAAARDELAAYPAVDGARSLFILSFIIPILPLYVATTSDHNRSVLCISLRRLPLITADYRKRGHMS